MKINKLILTVLACAIMVSCGDDLADLNKNPNVSTAGGTGAEVFTSAIGYYGVALDAFFNQDDALFAQYWAGGPGVALLDHERYFVEPADFNNEWSLSYLQALSDLNYVRAGENEALASAADILSVLIFQNLVDHYGDIPYFSALKGDAGVLAPAYDDDAVIYGDLETRLDAAIAVLADTDDEMGDEDLIYQGDISNWIRLANSLKLRILMRQSITGNAVTIGAKVQDLISEGTFITDESNLARIPFGGATGQNYNPQYARGESFVQFYVASKSTTDVLDDLNDPRGLVLFDEAEDGGGLIGLKQGNINDEPAGVKPADFSFPSAVQYGESNDVILMSHWEVMFLRAEAAMRYATSDNEKAMYDAAVTAHFDYIGAAGAAGYLAANAFYDVNATALQKSNQIGVQKWISMNGLQEAEGWIESRRFDQAGSNVFTNTTDGIFTTPTRSVFATGVYPIIRLYPQTEISFNAANVPAGRTLTGSKVFWDN